MTTRRAYDEITLRHGTHAVTLRPSLRAATRLERFQKGFPALLLKIGEFHTDTIREVIRASATDQQAADDLLRRAAQAPLAPFAEASQGAILDLLAALINPADDTNTRPEPTAKPLAWAEVYRQLYRIATGWLGWTPETAWNATPAEIEEAFKGHIAKLKAIHGAADTPEADAPTGYTQAEINRMIAAGGDPTFERNKLRDLKAKGGAR